MFLFSTLRGLRCLADGICSEVHFGPVENKKKKKLKHATTVTKSPQKAAGVKEREKKKSWGKEKVLKKREDEGKKVNDNSKTV